MSEHASFMIGATPCRVTRLAGGNWRAECSVQTPHGTRHVTRTANDAKVRQLVSVELRRRGRPGVGPEADRIVGRVMTRKVARGLRTEVGSVWGWVKRKARKIARSPVVRTVESVAKKVLKNPAVQGATAAALSAYGVPPAATREYMKSLGRLPPGMLALGAIAPAITSTAASVDVLQRAARGDRGARDAVAGVASQAAAGNPDAARAHNALRVAARGLREVPKARELLGRARAGDPRAVAAVRRVRQGADEGDPNHLAAFAALRAAAPGAGVAVRDGRRSTAMATTRGGHRLDRARIVAATGTSDGKHLVVVEVGGPVWDWVRQNWGLHRGIRDDRQQFSARDAYRQGARAFGYQTKMRSRVAGTYPEQMGRLVRVGRAQNGKVLCCFEVAGPVMDWVKRNWGWHRGTRSDEDLFSARDAYRQGAAAFGYQTKMRRAARR